MELGHRQHQPRAGTVGQECRRLAQQRDGLCVSALTILGQSLHKLGIGTVKVRGFRTCGDGPVRERDRAPEFLPRSRQEQAGQAIALGDGPVAGGIAEAFEQGPAGPAVGFVPVEECAELGVAVPGVMIRRVTCEGLLPSGAGLLQPAPRRQGPGQVSGAGPIGIQPDGVAEGS